MSIEGPYFATIPLPSPNAFPAILVNIPGTDGSLTQKLPTIPSKRLRPHDVTFWRAFNAVVMRRYPTRLGNLWRYHFPSRIFFLEESSELVGQTMLTVRITPSTAVISPMYSRLEISARLRATPSAGRNEGLPAVITSENANSCSLHGVAWAVTRSRGRAPWEATTACLTSSSDSKVVKDIQCRK